MHQNKKYTLYQLVLMNTFPWLKQTYSAYRNAVMNDLMGKNYLKAKKVATEKGLVYQITQKNVELYKKNKR